ncbi:hypothetical protein DL98DRAFT_267640 [Cadophora sp. DSE1049]|nr:hypothetical protein DL98DRAFT_267640 [Cadophora sp. DSE1049]
MYLEGQREATETNLGLKGQSKVSRSLPFAGRKWGSLGSPTLSLLRTGCLVYHYWCHSFRTQPQQNQQNAVTPFESIKTSSSIHNEVVETRPSISRRIKASPYSMVPADNSFTSKPQRWRQYQQQFYARAGIGDARTIILRETTNGCSLKLSRGSAKKHRLAVAGQFRKVPWTTA